MVPLALHDLLDLHVQLDQLGVLPVVASIAATRGTSHVEDDQLAGVDVDQIAVLEDKGLVRVLDDGRRVGREVVVAAVCACIVVPGNLAVVEV